MKTVKEQKENGKSVVEAYLDKWAKLEPAKCRSEVIYYMEGGNHRTAMYYFPAIEAGFTIDRAIKGAQAIHKRDTILIQGALQEAIEARNWTWTLLLCDERFSAFIHRPGENVFMTTAVSPVLALMHVYLESIAAEYSTTAE